MTSYFDNTLNHKLFSQIDAAHTVGFGLNMETPEIKQLEERVERRLDNNEDLDDYEKKYQEFR